MVRAAKRLGWAVKWTGDRHEAFLTDYTARYGAHSLTHAQLGGPFSTSIQPTAGPLVGRLDD